MLNLSGLVKGSLVPSYDYQCPLCQQVKEIRHSIHVDPDIPCDNPECSGQTTVIMKRKISFAPACILKKKEGSITSSDRIVK